MAGTITVDEIAPQFSVAAQIAPYVFPSECRENGCRLRITTTYLCAENADILDFWHNEERGFFGISARAYSQDSSEIRSTIIRKIHRWFLNVHREMFSRHAAIRYVALESEVL